MSKKKKTPRPKIIMWDLETTNLNANYGYILCGGWKELGVGKAKCKNITQFPQFKKKRTNDRDLVIHLRDVLSEADMWVTWYGSRFDVPYLNSRLLYHGEDPLPPIPHIDGWRVARWKMKLNSNRLQSVTQFLGLEEKTPILPQMWIDAMAGDRRAIRYVVEHCLQDVVVLEQVYERIKPLITDHPNVNMVTGTPRACPVCGSISIQKRGWNVAKVRRSQRYHCQACGAWSRGRPEKHPRADIEVR